MPLSRALLAAVNREIADRTTAGRRITPADLAHATGIPDKTLRRRLDGEVRMDPDTFESLCVALGVTVEDMWARARHIQATEQWDSTTVELLDGLPPRKRAEVEAMRAERERERERESGAGGVAGGAARPKSSAP